MKLQEFLFIDSIDQTLDLRKGGIGRSENGVGRGTFCHQLLHIIKSVDKFTESFEGMSDSRFNISVGGAIIGRTGAK